MSLFPANECLCHGAAALIAIICSVQSSPSLARSTRRCPSPGGLASTIAYPRLRSPLPRAVTTWFSIVVRFKAFECHFGIFRIRGGGGVSVVTTLTFPSPSPVRSSASKRRASEPASDFPFLDIFFFFCLMSGSPWGTFWSISGTFSGSAGTFSGFAKGSPSETISRDLSTSSKVLHGEPFSVSHRQAQYFPE